MKTATKLGAAGALAFVGVAAHASIAAPSSGAGDAILFAEVVNAAGTAAVASYAGDTGISINTILSGGADGQTVLGTDSNLAALFAADKSGDTLYFAVLGGQYSGANTLANFANPGAAQFLTTVTGNSTTSLAATTTSSLFSKWNPILTSTIASVNTNIQASSTPTASSIEGASASTSGVWDVTDTTGVSFWSGSVENGNVVGGSENLYYVTAGTGGAATTKVATTFEATVTLSSSGLTFAAPAANAVPLPAAVWLLGSGLLGLAGVGRRKLQS